jgi:crossover junction endodeoxyribonuclease RuvC
VTTVVGLDPSLTAFGLARIAWCGEKVVAETWKRGEDGITALKPGPAYEAMNHIVADVISFSNPADLVVIEGASFDSRSKSSSERAYVWWRTVGRLSDRGIPVLVVSPNTRAKWATGNGRAGKVEVAVAVARLWRDVEIRNDNEADALGLASMAMQLLGGPCPFALTKWRTDVVSGLRLPEGEAA